MEEGSLYPALHRLEQQGWIDSEWALSDTNGRVRYCKLTAGGKPQLALEEEDWKHMLDVWGGFFDRVQSIEIEVFDRVWFIGVV